MEVVSDARAEFERIFREHYATVYRYATRRVESAAVQDVVADTFLTAWRRFDQVDGDVLPWLLGIARRVCANHLRGRERRAALRERLMAEPAADHSASARDDRELLAALAALREEDREALLLVGWDGLSNPQAALVARCSTGAFTVRLHRARRRLARALNAQRTDDAAAKDNQEGVVIHDAT
jgi:RNA polymerase sigma-70 factor, ECF subfamily